MSSWPEVPRNAAILLTANSDLQISVHSLLGSSRLREHAHTWFASWIIYVENRDPGLDVWKPPSNYIQHHQQFNIRLYLDQVSKRIEMFRENCFFFVKLPSIQLSSRAVKDTHFLQFPLPKQRFMSCSDSYGASWEVPNRSLMKCHHYVIASPRWTMI